MKLAKSVSEWMAAVLEERGWTAEEWAQKAGTSGTNITRLLSGTTESVPKLDTLQKLADAAGIDLSSIFAGQPGVRRLPVLTKEQLMKGEIVASEISSINSVVTATDDPAHYAVRIESDSYDLGGIVFGDIVTVVPQTNYHKGDVVVVLKVEGTAAYEYQPPVLMPHSTARYDALPLADHDKILGRASTIIRKLIR